MKRFICIFISLALLSSMPVSISAKELNPKQNSGKVQTIQKLNSLSKGKLKLNEKGGQVFISGNLANKQITGEKSARKFLEENKPLFGIDNVTDDLKAVEVKKDDIGHTYVKFAQVIKGIKVKGNLINVNFDKSGTIVSVNGKFEKNKSVTTLGNRDVSESDAVEIAKKQYTYKILRNTPKVDKLILTKDKKNYEVFKVNISYTDPTIGNYDVFVEVHSGKVIKTENNIRFDGAISGSGIDVLGKNKNLNLYKYGTSYQMMDLTKSATSSIDTYTLNHGTYPSGPLVSNISDFFNTVDYKASVSAHYNAGKVTDFYKNLFNRNSLDGNGMAIKSYTHYGNSYNNAFWDGYEMIYGDGDGYNFTYLSGDLDVVGHEMTHGVISNTANLQYHNQSGALNESMADVFGVFISTYDKYNVASGGNWAFNTADWVIGDDIYTPYTPGDALRSLSNPTLYDQPDNMSNYENSSDNDSGDWGGVHTNSGIPNKAAYLTVKNIGVEKTAKIYYRALVTYMNENTDFEQAKVGLEQAATDLYGANSVEVTAVNNSFYSVGVGEAPVNDLYEPNDTMETSYPINLGTRYQSYISSNTDVDYYKLNVNKTGDMCIALSDLPFDYDLDLYNPSGQVIGSSASGSTSSEFINFNAGEIGNYYIKVYPYSGFSTTQKYSLIVTKPLTGVTGVSLDKTTANLKVGEVVNLISTVNPTDATNKNVIWSSGDASVATVNNAGKVTAVRNGTTTLTVTTADGGYTATCDVTVQSVQVTGISLNRSDAELKTSESITLVATINPTVATNKNVTWLSSNDSIATVNSIGKVTAVGKGTATITVRTVDGGYTDSCSVSVTQSVTGVILDKTTAGLKVGESTSLRATVRPADAFNNNATWSSTNSSVASVDGAGKVTALGIGTATIKITTADGGYTSSCNIIVFQAPAVPIGLQAISAGYNNIKISWGAVTGASGYEIYRSTSSSGTYSKVGEIASLNYINSSLITGTNYYYKVRAYKTVWATKYYGNYSSIISAKPVLPVPASAVAVSAGYNSIKISWGVVSGSSGNEIYRSTSNSGTYSKVGEVTASTYIDTGLTIATTYYYKVRSYRAVGTTRIYGGYSSIVSAKPIPLAPISVNAVSASYNSNKITWGAVSGASAYQVYRAISSTGIYSLINTTTSLSYTNTGLSTGKTYYYKIMVYRTIGTTKVYSLYSTVVSSKPVPATPASPKAVSSSYNSIKVNWGIVREASGYEVYRSTSSAGTYGLVNSTNTLAFSNAGLKTGIAYFYKIRSFKIVGSTKVLGNCSAVVSAKPIPSVPTNAYAISTSYNAIKISWVASGGANGYEVYKSTSSTGAYSLVTSTTATSYINTGLATNTNYYYRIRSYNTNGTSKLYGGFSSTVSSKPIPAIPTSVKAVSSSYNSNNISWIKISGASGYEVYTASSSAGPYRVLGTTSALSYNNTGLTTGRTYYYKVRAYTTVGNTRVYSSYSAVVLSKVVLSVPASVKAILSSYNSIKTSWSAVSGASGYMIYRSTSSAGAYNLLSTTTSTSYNNTGLTTNKTYYYKVIAYRTVGTTKLYSGYSMAVSAVSRAQYTPNYSVLSLSETNAYTSVVIFYITNYGPTPLKIYSAGSNLLDNDSTVFNRNLQMVDSTTAKDITSIEFPTGSSGWVCFRVKGNPTWYDAKSRINYEFTYDNVWYNGSASYYYGPWYSKK
ncbi:M4 family metallopeptidase [Clostridium lacusfryxellense]|uniref:M4 family metallopeptidase n=1 Tax=Clostridium lacusfryxellense TaxID=205328 RepID=UPI001C0CC742|nr:M4 family metallopeptidase [Clostridium lacusfryxellense]MBU3111007.1 M4 family metallopeptidase [Clostridium lacusfryxellense]